MSDEKDVVKKQPDYPSSVEEVLDDNADYSAELLAIMNRFKVLSPWRGSPLEKAAKYYWLHNQLCLLYRKSIYLTFSDNIFENMETSDGNGAYIPDYEAIVIIGKLSVITFLHEWGHAIYGTSEREACRWSINLFRKIFPKQFAKLAVNGHLLLTKPE